MKMNFKSIVLAILFMSVSIMHGDKVSLSTNLVIDEAMNTGIVADIENVSQPALSYEIGLYSWSKEVYEPLNKSDFYLVLKKLEITEVYQNFDEIDIDKEEAFAFAKDLALIDVKLYNLVGDHEWVETGDARPLLKKINHTANLRDKWGKTTLEGIVIDIEPYISERWEKDKILLMDNFIKIMESAYKKAKEMDLKVIVAIPAWYDGYFIDYLTELSNVSDELSVMNYNRNHEYENIIGEIELAKDLNKSITCIFEFQEIGKHSLESSNTYNEVGIDIAIENFEKIYKKANYSRLKFAYHYYDSVRNLLIEW